MLRQILYRVPFAVSAKAIAIRKASTAAPLANRYYLFNYFEPYDDTATLQSVWTTGSEYVKTLNGFIATYLHHSTDPKAMFPWVNFMVADTVNLPMFGKKDDQWIKYMQSIMSYNLPANPGCFREIATYSGRELLAEDNERSSKTRFLITAVQAKDGANIQDIDRNWEEFTGARFLDEQLNNDDNLVDSYLYKSHPTPSPFPPRFSHTVRTELRMMSDNDGHDLAKLVNTRPNIPNSIETTTSFYEVAIPVKKK
ncbi:unnamed protein product [Clavelina lepadiformis]|uniref:DUF7153 domain-containing protein n=1 Tax=Clavelina lepadiformis TaxID=159417 RepID=A0ABP0FVG9_CLALP